MSNRLVKICQFLGIWLCSSVNAASPFSVTSNGPTLTIGTSLDHTYSYAGIKLLDSNYSFSSCSEQNGYCIFSVSKSTTSEIGISGAYTNGLSISLCLDARYPRQCFLHSVRIAPIKSNLAFISNANGSGLNTVKKCTVNNDGSISSCSSTGSGFGNPYSIALHPKGLAAYVTNSFDNTLSTCAISSEGELSGCSLTTSNFTTPLGIKTNTTGSLVYFTAGSDNKVIKCSTSSSGSIIGCSSSGNSLDVPADIAIHATSSRAFVSNYNDNSVTSCALDPVGDLTNCAAAGSNFTAPTGLAINHAGTRLYVLNGTQANATMCSISSSGILSSCTTTGDGFSGPKSIWINETDSAAYISNATAGTVLKCGIDSATGALASSCTIVLSSATGVSAITLTE